jgi:hypothetical protein
MNLVCEHLPRRLGAHRRAVEIDSLWIGREELFERERHGDLDFQVWDRCVMACAEARGSGI